MKNSHSLIPLPYDSKFESDLFFHYSRLQVIFFLKNILCFRSIQSGLKKIVFERCLWENELQKIFHRKIFFVLRYLIIWSIHDSKFGKIILSTADILEDFLFRIGAGEDCKKCPFSSSMPRCHQERKLSNENVWSGWTLN